jgi:hypothetical protein
MAAGATYEPITTTTTSSNQTTVSFTSITGSYTDLVLVCAFKNTSSVDIILQFNSDGGNNYSYVTFGGDGTTVGDVRGYNTTAIVLDVNAAGFGTDRSIVVVDIMNYSNTSTAKTVISRVGTVSGAPNVGMTIGTRRNTAAITTIDISASSANTIASGSKFTLYGISAA